MENRYTNIDFSELKLVLENKVINEPSGRKEFLDDNFKWYSIHDGDKHRWDYDSYIRRLNNYITDNNLEKNIVIEKLEEAETIKESDKEYLVKYKIFVKWLNIDCKKYSNIDFMPLLCDEYKKNKLKTFAEKYKGGIYIVFENNLFYTSINNYYSYLYMILGENAKIVFINNNFTIDLYLSATQDNTHLSLISNKFDNRHVTISGAKKSNEGITYGSNGWFLKDSIYAKYIRKKRFERSINKDHSSFLSDIKDKLKDDNVDISDLLKYLISSEEKISVGIDDIVYKEKISNIQIKDNEFIKLAVLNNGFYLKGKNIIKKFEVSMDFYQVYFGPYNVVDIEGRYPRQHKRIFADMLSKSILNKDKSQEILFRREIMKCDRVIFEEEIPSQYRGLSRIKHDKSRADRFVLWFNHVSNDFGMNWYKPIYIILGINLIFSLCVYYFLGYEISLKLSDIFRTLGEYSSFLIPTNSVSKVLEIPNLNKGWESINLLKNVLFSVLIYQSITAFRKYSSK